MAEQGSISISIEADIKKLKTGMDAARKEIELTKKDIEKLQGTVDKSTKSQEKTTEAFSKSTTALLAFGNVANSVDNIMDSYANMQIRIENAELRVIEAREDLIRLTEEGKQGTLEYESAVRRLQISENNLERANNTVLGTYINMGIQVVNLTASLPKAAAAVREMAVAMGILNITSGGLIGVLGIATVAGAALIPMLANTKSQMQENTSQARNYAFALGEIPSQVNTTITQTGVPTATSRMGTMPVNPLFEQAAAFAIGQLEEQKRAEQLKIALDLSEALTKEITNMNELTNIKNKSNQTDSERLTLLVNSQKEIDKYTNQLNMQDESTKKAVNSLIQLNLARDAEIKKSEEAAKKIKEDWDIRFGSKGDSGMSYAQFQNKRQEQIRTGIINQSKTK